MPSPIVCRIVGTSSRTQALVLSVAAITMVAASAVATPASANTCPGGMTPVAGLANVCEQVFTSSDTFNLPDGAQHVEAFILGGGGGGGAGRNIGGGGGGGGGDFAVVAAPSSAGSTFTISVGSGGAGGATSGSNGSNGQSSIVDWGTTTFSAVGGGGGRGGPSNSTDPGGRGGDSGAGVNLKSGGTGGTTFDPDGGGGGGGAGTAQNGSAGVGTGGGNGGAGSRPDATQDLFGNLARSYGGGGGGGGQTSNSFGNGADGGGRGGSPPGTTATAEAGDANTGGGGGGGGAGFAGAAGGSGLVIIRIQFGDDPEQAPPPILQQVGRFPDQGCEDLDIPELNWAGVASGGWGKSWAEWAVPVTGGAVCVRELFYDSPRSRWAVRD